MPFSTVSKTLIFRGYGDRYFSFFIGSVSLSHCPPEFHCPPLMKVEQKHYFFSLISYSIASLRINKFIEILVQGSTEHLAL